MSTANPKKKFKDAVSKNAASSSTKPSSKSTSSSGSVTHLTIPQANNLQILHQEQLARLSSSILPKLASQHSRRFLNLARNQLKTTDSMWTTDKLISLSYRRALWAEDIEPDDFEGKREENNRVVPDFYHKHNPRCSKCALPLIPALNHLSTTQYPKSASKLTFRKIRPSNNKNSNKRVSYCILCNSKTRS
ncbi:uncharacterized protein MEPE_00579 [Melanopsichium pennsylvanicum]|uniref:Uncharacterized protein n=1 Tax=Melanopsichium pennsylvanicum TaxID=63383 RepID=A0AAJ4XGB8_9BASI|nr:uncharacterized protein MEPE_00579 [Melanopsichium pennsylvanicum]